MTVANREAKVDPTGVIWLLLIISLGLAPLPIMAVRLFVSPSALPYSLQYLVIFSIEPYEIFTAIIEFLLLMYIIYYSKEITKIIISIRSKLSK